MRAILGPRLEFLLDEDDGHVRQAMIPATPSTQAQRDRYQRMLQVDLSDPTDPPDPIAMGTRG